MKEEEQKPNSLQIVLDGKPITIKIAGQEYNIPTPFSFPFWRWLLDSGNYTIEIPEQIGDFIIKDINKVIAKLIGLLEEEIIKKQTEEEMLETTLLILNQLNIEINASPFARKALRLKQLINQLNKKIKEPIGGQLLQS